MGGTIDGEIVRLSEHYETRIKQLERLNATLSAEVDRMWPVVEATIKQVNRNDDRFSWYELKKAVNDYEAAKEQGEYERRNISERKG